jgi:hypothetical protein
MGEAKYIQSQNYEDFYVIERHLDLLNWEKQLGACEICRGSGWRYRKAEQ